MGLASSDLLKIRAEYPILGEDVGKQTIFFDNASTTHKPIAVINAIVDFYKSYNSNIHRSINAMSNKATETVERCRDELRKFINASLPEEIVFTRGATDGANIIAQSYLRDNLEEGDEVLISVMEHNSNILPWIEVCKEKKCVIKYIPLRDDYSLDLDLYKKMLSSRTKLVAVTHLSNVLGVCNPIAEIVKCAKRVGSVVFVDAAQSFCSMEIDVKELGCHFLVASGHKAYGPTGIGFLYVCKDIFNKIGVANVGGGTINKFYEGDVIYADFPYRLEPGTLPIASIIGLEASINYVKGIKISNIIDHKRSLTSLFLERMLKFNSVTVLNSEYNQSGIVSCYVNSYNVSDIALLLNAYMICSRAGFLCCHKLMDYLGINGAFRISFAVYNTVEEIDFFFDKFSRVLTKYIL